MSATPIEMTTDATVPVLQTFVRDRVRDLLQTNTTHRLEGLYPALMRDVERSLLDTVLEHVQGHRQEAARILGLHRNTLRLRLRATGLDDAHLSKRDPRG